MNAGLQALEVLSCDGWHRSPLERAAGTDYQGPPCMFSSGALRNLKGTVNYNCVDAHS